MGETINAVIWLSDLRGSPVSESSPRDELIEMLNRYFGPMCARSSERRRDPDSLATCAGDLPLSGTLPPAAAH
jgi:hypothetical protein